MTDIAHASRPFPVQGEFTDVPVGFALTLGVRAVARSRLAAAVAGANLCQFRHERGPFATQTFHQPTQIIRVSTDDVQHQRGGAEKRSKRRKHVGDDAKERTLRIVRRYVGWQTDLISTLVRHVDTLHQRALGGHEVRLHS